MLRKIFTLFTLTFLFFLSISAQIQVKKDVATLKYNLSEFHDASVWKSRASLTLFSPDGKYLAVSGKSADIIIYETGNGNILSKIDGDGFRAFSFSPDGKFVVAQDTSDFVIHIFETETGKELRQIRGLGGVNKISKALSGGMAITSYEMTPVPISTDWKKILVNKNDREYAVYDFETGNLKYELAHDNYSSSWEIAKIFLTGTAMIEGVPMATLLLKSSSSSQFSPDGKYVIIANGNKNPTLWNAETGNLISKLEANAKVYFVFFSPDSKNVATSDSRGTVKIWDSETGKNISSFGADKEKGFITDWNKDGTKVFVSPFRKGDVKIYDVRQGGDFLYKLENSNSAGAILSNNRDYVVTTPRKGKTVYFQIWEAETGKLLATVPREKNKSRLISIKWSPNDQMLVTSAGLKNDVELWNLKGERLQTLKNATFPAEFSRDSKFLLTGGKVSATEVQNDVGYLWEIDNRQ